MTGAGQVEVATRRDLQAAGRLGTWQGALAIKLARVVDDPATTDDEVAAASRELRAVLADALRDRDRGVLDELAARRARRLGRLP